MSAAAAAVKAALLALTDEDARRKLGWVLAAILSPVILLIVLLCALASGGAEHNVSVVELCFYGGTMPADTPVEYRAHIQTMQDAFALLDEQIAQTESSAEGEESLDATRIKAVFFVLYFGAEDPAAQAGRGFVDCFVTYEERTHTVTAEDEDGNEVELEEVCTVAVPISDLETVWANVEDHTGSELSEEQRASADSIYNLIRYGVSTGPEDWIPGAGVPYMGADGFCSPIGSGWESRVTSEFGYRRDPFTGESRGHTGMDLAVPTGTPIRAALPGTVTVSQYNSSSGYPDGTFGPDRAITRAEVMALVNEVLERAPDADYMLKDMTVWPDNPKSAWYYEDVQEATNSHSYVWRNTQHTIEDWEDFIPMRTFDELVRDAFRAAGR